MVLILGPLRGTSFGGQRVETGSAAPGPGVGNNGGRASQIALALRQRRLVGAVDSGRGAAILSAPPQVITSYDQRHPKAKVPLPPRGVQAAKFLARSVPQSCETEPENGPDSRTTWWSRKRDRGLRPELYPKGSFVSKSYTEWSFVVAVRRRRGPVFGTRIWSSKWDRKLLHGRAKTATVVLIFGRWGLAILCVCGAICRPPFADPRPTPTRLALEAAQPAAPQSSGGRRWPGWRGGRAGMRHVTTNSAVSLRCPPVLVPPSGPILRTVLVVLSLSSCVPQVV